MPIYNAPLKDMEFILNDVFKADEFWRRVMKTLLI